MTNASKDSFHTLTPLSTSEGEFHFFNLRRLAEEGLGDPDRLPYSIKILVESVLRGENGHEITREDVARIAAYDPASPGSEEIPFSPARVLLQDFTGVPAVVDLAAMREAMTRAGGDPKRINPLVPVDLVIDHSVQVDAFRDPSAIIFNQNKEMERNQERYRFLRWGQKAFDNFGVVPPGSGIVHQVNLEYLANVVRRESFGGREILFSDSLVGTDSHTTMINGLGVLGWGVGGIEAEAVMLGQPYYMTPPKVVGMRFTGKLPEGATATDLVLAVTQVLRAHGVVGRFVEFFGPGLKNLSLPDRATLANMAPEYGATVGFFPVDDETLRYLALSGRSKAQIERIEAYAKAQGLFASDDRPEPQYFETLNFDLSTVEPSLAGPKRPQDRIALSRLQRDWAALLEAPVAERGFALEKDRLQNEAKVAWEDGREETLRHGSVVIAAITSCTNTSNPSVMIAAGLVAKKAVERGLTVARYVKTSLAPGSKVVTEYLQRSGLMPYLETLGFHLVGYGCTTCIGNSGPLPAPVSNAIEEGKLVAASVLSGNRNFEGRVHQRVKANFLASPPLVVAYALAGTVDIDLSSQPIGKDELNREVTLAELWPSREEIEAVIGETLRPELFREQYENIESGDTEWNAIEVADGDLYPWDARSTYIKLPPFFENLSPDVPPLPTIENARLLVTVGDSTTTDHISPAGAIKADTPAGKYLIEKGIFESDFNSYGSRRGNDEVMTRGTFANIRLKNRLAPGTEGGFTTHFPTGEVVSIFEAARRYRSEHTPTLVIAGKDYGMGSSRDWAAKGTYLLGIKAVIAQSFERIHRSNLVGMGVLPLTFEDGQSFESLGLKGDEYFRLECPDDLKPGQSLTVEVTDSDGNLKRFRVLCRLDTKVEIEYYRNGGILHTVLRRLLAESL